MPQPVALFVEQWETLMQWKKGTPSPLLVTPIVHAVVTHTVASPRHQQEPHLRACDVNGTGDSFLNFQTPWAVSLASQDPQVSLSAVPSTVLDLSPMRLRPGQHEHHVDVAPSQDLHDQPGIALAKLE